MQKKYTSLGLMSGTSGDGVDASIINSNGLNEYEVIRDKYFEYDNEIYKEIHTLKENIFNINDLKKYSQELANLERKITLFHAKVIKEFEVQIDDFIVGFHGQTILHRAPRRLLKGATRQLGDGQAMANKLGIPVVYDFR